MNVGNNLRDLRKDHRYTLRTVSEGTGLSISFLSDIELGRTNPSLESLQKLAQCYAVPISHLIEEENPDEPNPIERPGWDEFLQEVSIQEDMKRVLLEVERYSRRRAEVKEDWIQYYYTLKQIMGR